MAEDIQKAFLSEWPNAMGSAALPAINSQMQLMFVAIAQGIIRHLADNQASIQITYDDAGTSATATTTVVTSGTLY